MKIKTLNQFCACVLSVCVAVYSTPLRTVSASQVALAADEAEAQNIGPAAGAGASDGVLYPFIGSGFTGVGKEIKGISREIIQALFPQTLVPEIKTVPSPLELVMPIPPAAVVDETAAPQPGTPKPVAPLPVLGDVVSEVEQLREAEQAVQRTLLQFEHLPAATTGQAQEKEKEDEKPAPLFLPTSGAPEDELAALLEGELAGAPVFGMGLKITGGILALVGIIFLILGTSGIFSSGGDGGGSGSPGEGPSDPNEPEIPGGGGDDDDEDDTNPVPEPGMLFLFGWAALCGFLRRRRLGV